MYFKERFPIPADAPRAPLHPGRRTWASKGTLTENYKSLQDAVCHFCKCAIPAGTPCKIRSMCVFVACMSCEYPHSAGNYQ